MRFERPSPTETDEAAEWTHSLTANLVSRERAKGSFEGFVDPAEIDRIFDLWREAFPS